MVLLVMKFPAGGRVQKIFSILSEWSQRENVDYYFSLGKTKRQNVYLLQIFFERPINALFTHDH